MPVASDPVIAVSELDEVYTQLRSLWYFTENLSSEFGDALRAVGRKWGVVLDGPSDVTFRMQDGSLWTLQGSQKLFDAMTEGPYLYGSSHRHGDPTKEAIEDAMSDLEGQARKTS